MRILIAPDKFKGSLSAREVAKHIATGIRRVLPQAQLSEVPMADGGEGTVQSLVDATDGEKVAVTVTGPLGKPVEAFFGILGDRRTAVIEMASASGLVLVPPEKRDPRVTTCTRSVTAILTTLPPTLRTAPTTACSAELSVIWETPAARGSDS
jgi:glycerate kinase